MFSRPIERFMVPEGSTRWVGKGVEIVSGGIRVRIIRISWDL